LLNSGSLKNNVEKIDNIIVNDLETFKNDNKVILEGNRNISELNDVFKFQKNFLKNSLREKMQFRGENHDIAAGLLADIHANRIINKSDEEIYNNEEKRDKLIQKYNHVKLMIDNNEFVPEKLQQKLNALEKQVVSHVQENIPRIAETFSGKEIQKIFDFVTDTAPLTPEQSSLLAKTDEEINSKYVEITNRINRLGGIDKINPEELLSIYSFVTQANDLIPYLSARDATIAQNSALPAFTTSLTNLRNDINTLVTTRSTTEKKFRDVGAEIRNIDSNSPIVRIRQRIVLDDTLAAVIANNNNNPSNVAIPLTPKLFLQPGINSSDVEKKVVAIKEFLVKKQNEPLAIDDLNSIREFLYFNAGRIISDDSREIIQAVESAYVSNGFTNFKIQVPDPDREEFVFLKPEKIVSGIDETMVPKNSLLIEGSKLQKTIKNFFVNNSEAKNELKVLTTHLVKDALNDDARNSTTCP
jgi:hypothetical protein